MQVPVYRTRRRGVRLPQPAAGVTGHLQLDLWRVRATRQLAAKLTSAPDGATLLLPEPNRAAVEEEFVEERRKPVPKTARASERRVAALSS